jgi:pyruvate dehydrogenase E1 component beta subunit
MVTAPHTPVPFSNTLEDLYMPDAQRIVNAVKTVAEWAR